MDENLEKFIDNILKDAEKIRSKLPNLSRTVQGKQVILKIKKIYSFKEKNSKFFLLQVRNYEKTPKYLYFLGKRLVSQSSDLIVLLAKEFAIEHDIELVQFPLHPQTRRVNLLALKRLPDGNSYPETVDLLNSYKKRLSKKMEKIKRIAED
ncbi:MAG: hypothetical protein R6U96_15145 [Promethearchaeia archaeon]